MTSTSRQSAFSVHFCIPWFFLEVPSKTITPHHTSVLIIQWLTGSVMRACKLLLLFVAATLAISSVTAGYFIRSVPNNQAIHRATDNLLTNRAINQSQILSTMVKLEKKIFLKVKRPCGICRKTIMMWSSKTGRNLSRSSRDSWSQGPRQKWARSLCQPRRSCTAISPPAFWQIVTSTHQNLTSQLQNRFDTTLGKVIWSAVEGVLRVCRVHELMTIKVL